MTANEIFGAGFSGMTDKGKLESAAKELEAVVLTQLMATMRQTIPEGGLLEKSASEELFRSLLDGEIARSMSEKSPFGLADSIVKEFENRFKEADAPTEAPSEAADPARAAGTVRGRSWRI